mmetsp:Transcript_3645/g.4171  ORF Transcript_3645/g.4171 Transcript_3645/m.4171 type:complete len:221 (-) Transcript_3645:198-860(-)
MPSNQRSLSKRTGGVILEMGARIDIRAFPKLHDRIKMLLERNQNVEALFLMRQLFYYSYNIGMEGWLTKTILIVDDSRMLRNYLTRIIEDSGYAVEVACNGSEALIAMKRRYFDCVLIDLQMPVMGGLRCAEALRIWEAEIQRPSRQVLCAISSSSDPSRQRSALSAGIDYFECKPVQPSIADTIISWGVTSRNRVLMREKEQSTGGGSLTCSRLNIQDR